MGIVLRGVTAALGETLTVKRVDIRIAGKTIDTISESPLSGEGGDTVISGEGKLAVPGLVNAHTHIPMVLFRGLADDVPLSEWLSRHLWPLEKRLTPEEVYWGSLLGLAESIKSGTTAFSDMYFHVDAIGKAAVESGMKALLSYGIIAPKLDKTGKEELARAEGTVERFKDEERIQVAIGPHSVYTCGKEVWKEAISLARKDNLLLHTHLAETRDEVAQCYLREGISPVELLERWGALSGPVIAAHCVHVRDADIEILAAHGVNVAHCPKSNAKLGSGIAPLRKMRKMGVRVALGTDGAASNNSLDMLSEMRFAALLAKGQSEDPTVVTAREALGMATAAGAAALGIKGGRIEVGAPADIALIDLTRLETVPAYDPLSALVYAAGREAVSDVLVDGRFLLRDGALTTIDEDRVKYEVGKIANRYRN